MVKQKAIGEIGRRTLDWTTIRSMGEWGGRDGVDFG